MLKLIQSKIKVKPKYPTFLQQNFEQQAAQPPAKLKRGTQVTVKAAKNSALRKPTALNTINESEEIQVPVKCFARIVNCRSWKPSGMTGATFTCVGDKGILIGGSSFQVTSEIVLFRIRPQTWVSQRQLELGLQHDDEFS